MVTNCIRPESLIGLLCEFVNGVKGINDMEGKAATGSGEQAGKRASFKFASVK
jgi:hypothetical protein